MSTLEPRSQDPTPVAKPAGDETAAFEARARELLKDSIERVDGRTRSRLTQARAAAVGELAAAPPSGGLHGRRWLVPAGGLAAMVLVVMVWFAPNRGPVSGLQTVGTQAGEAAAAFDDLEIMAVLESFELIEDLEFYVWLDSETAAPPVAGNGSG